MSGVNNKDDYPRQIPAGFTIVIKKDLSTKVRLQNLCLSCDARPLCQENENEWCIKYPCMSYSRIDEKSVVFRKVTK